MKSLILKGITCVDSMEFHDIEGGFGLGKKSMLAKDIAEIHKKDLRHINEAINSNRKRFTDGIHIIDLKSVDLVDRDLLSAMGFSNSSIANANNIYLLSERGYAVLLKILEDDVAWTQYEKLVDGYFNMRAKKKINSTKADKVESLYNVTLAVKQVTELYKAAGMKDVHLLMAAKMLYRKADVDLPVLELKAEQELFSKEDIAINLGVYSSSDKPHSAAIGAIINVIEVRDDEKELIHYEKNGHDDTYYNYSGSVVEKVRQWLQNHQYPTVISGSKQNYKVVYKQGTA